MRRDATAARGKLNSEYAVRVHEGADWMRLLLHRERFGASELYNSARKETKSAQRKKRRGAHLAAPLHCSSVCTALLLRPFRHATRRSSPARHGPGDDAQSESHATTLLSCIALQQRRRRRGRSQHTVRPSRHIRTSIAAARANSTARFLSSSGSERRQRCCTAHAATQRERERREHHSIRSKAGTLEQEPRQISSVLAQASMAPCFRTKNNALQPTCDRSRPLLLAVPRVRVCVCVAQPSSVGWRLTRAFGSCTSRVCCCC